MITCILQLSKKHLQIRSIAIVILMILDLQIAVEAREIGVESTAVGSNHARIVLVDAMNFLDSSRKKTIGLIGQPKRSDELFPFTSRRSLIDYYDVKSHTEHLCITYSKRDIVLSTDIEPAPVAIPVFMREKVNIANLTDMKLRAFLSSVPDEKMRIMSAEQIIKKLGKPDRTWREVSSEEGREGHFLNYLYYLSRSGRKVFILMFNETSTSLYEYRLQSIND